MMAENNATGKGQGKKAGKGQGQRPRLPPYVIVEGRDGEMTCKPALNFDARPSGVVGWTVPRCSEEMHTSGTAAEALNGIADLGYRVKEATCTLPPALQPRLGVHGKPIAYHVFIMESIDFANPNGNCDAIRP